MSNHRFSALNLPELTISNSQIYTLKEPHVISVLIDEFPADTADPFFSGLAPGKIQKKRRADILKDLGLHLLDEYERFWEAKFETGRKGGWDHADQRRTLEKAIRLLTKAGAEADDVKAALGRAYLRRADIIRPKGFTVPAKKTEALKKSLAYFTDSASPDAAVGAGMAALELDRCGDIGADELERLLNKAAAQAAPPEQTRERMAFYQMLLRLAEIRMKTRKDAGAEPDPRLGALFDGSAGPGVELEQYKAAVLYPAAFAENAERARRALMGRLRRFHFSHPAWEDAVRFIRLLYNAGAGAWADLALDLWKIAEAKTVRSTVHLRWYWARQRNLYDLAFLAALDRGDVPLAAQIADSAKSKPALTWQAMEQAAAADDAVKQDMERHKQALGGGYIRDLAEADAQVPALAEISSFPAAPETPAIILQFYLVHLEELGEKGGFVLVYDREKGGWRCDREKHVFDFRTLFEAYVEWQTAYYHLPCQHRKKSAPALERLCAALGEQLAFIFNLPENDDYDRPLVFVPHDFLHRVPLHGALVRTEDGDAEPALDLFRCVWLPSLGHQAPPETESGAPRHAAVIKYFDRTQGANAVMDDEFNAALKEQWPDAPVFEGLSEAPDLRGAFVAFICHGLADPVNPFDARLVLNPEVSLLDLYAAADVIGADIFLSACETDLAPMARAPLDEHLSVAAVFLNRNARGVLGTMYEFYPDESRVEDLFQNAGGNVFEEIFSVQSMLFEKYADSKNPEDLYHALAYKLYQPLQASHS